MAGTRTVTVLFTDLVGSTALSQRLDAGSAEEMRIGHFAVLRGEVDAAGGTVVKNLGDGLMVVFDSPTAALSAAVAMQQVVERSNRRAVERLDMRVGLATGEAAESDGDFFGDPVVEAARLCAAADGGQILATDVVRVVAGRHAAQELVSVGSLELKGLPDPVACVEVRWEPAGGEPSMVPLQGRLEAASEIAFVGRADEFGELEAVLKEAGTQQRRRLVLVGGEPGIGKSALAAVFARSAHADGSVALYGRCDQDLGIPYQPWAEALTHLVDHAQPASLDEVLADHGEVLARLGSGLAQVGQSSGGGSADAETARYLLFGAVLRVLQAAAGDQPLVLVLDDLHWADTPTQQLLRHLVNWDQPLPVVVVATYRESEVNAGHPLSDVLAGLHREPGVTRISLRGLGDVELLALMEAGAGHAVDGNGLALRDALARETDGNPFFVGELLRHLAETGLVYPDGDGRWAVSGDLRDRGLPVSVREVIGRRVARLGVEAVRVLSVAAVIGRDFDLSVLASAAETAEEPLVDVLDAAVDATLVVNVAAERYSFVHALVEHALYDALSPTRRARAHRRVAEAIEQVCGADPGPRVGELAYHYAQATAPTDRAKAIGYAQAAGDRALVQLAPGEALRWYGQALSLLDRQNDDRPLRAALLVGLGDAQRQTGHPGFRNTLLAAADIAQAVGDTDTLIAAALANNRGFFSAIYRVDADRVAIIEAALAAIGGGDSALRARLLGLLSAERTWDGDYPGRRAVADQALSMARRLGDPTTILDVLLRRHDAIFVPGTLAERQANTAEAETLADHVGDPIGRFWSASFRMITAGESADLAEYTRCQDTLAGLAERIAQPTLRWLSINHQCVRVLLAGDAERAEVLAEDNLRIGTESAQPDALALYTALIGPIRWHQGRLAELLDMSVTAAANNPTSPVIRAGLTRQYADAGRVDDARRLLAAETIAGLLVPDDLGNLICLAFWAEAAARVHDPIAAEMLYERLAHWPNHVVCTPGAIYGAVAHYLGHLSALLGRHDTAEAHFAKAQAIHERLQAPFHLARTHLEWGRMLLARGRRDDTGEALAHLKSASDLAQRYGCALVEQRATDLLGQL